MNLGQRLAGALAALTGTTAAELAANTEADATFRSTTEATLTALGDATTDLKTKFDALAAKVEAGETVDPAEFAELKATIDSIDAAFPDSTVAPPEDDDDEDPIADDGSTV